MRRPGRLADDLDDRPAKRRERRGLAVASQLDDRDDDADDNAVTAGTDVADALVDPAAL